MKNVMIIGGSGFVGTRLISMLQDSHTVLNLDKATSQEHGSVTQIADVREPESFTSQLSGQDAVILLAAEHRDDVSPTSLYYDVNVEGMHNVLNAMDAQGVKNIVFTSSVAIYGMNQPLPPTEESPEAPFNHYGKSKWQAEQVLQDWIAKGEGRNALLVRPTVIFGEENRGNVYNLLKQIASGKFLMIGRGQNRKSMAYVGNVVAFIKYRLELAEEGYHVFNYIDKPDLTMTSLLGVIEKSLNKKIPSVRIPIWLGYLGGFGFDVLAFVTRKKLAISSVRVKKFVATTQFDATKVHSSGFRAPFTLEEGLDKTLNYEFVQERSDDDEVFYTE